MTCISAWLIYRHAIQRLGCRKRVQKMQKTKRKGRGKSITCLNKNKNASKAVLKQCSAFEDGFSNLVKSCGNSSSELTKQIKSKLSESVVSLASFDGDTVVSECTGILIENLCADTTTVLTSANLVGSLDDGFNEKLTIKVRLPSDRVVFGLLETFDSTYDLAVVKIRRARGFQEAHLSSSHPVQFESNSKVVAVGRCFDSGMLSFTDGKLIGPASYQIRELILSTYKMNTALNGCPLVDVNGNFVGVYFRRGKRTAFVPMNKILKFLEYSGITRHSAADTNDGPDPPPCFERVPNGSWLLIYEDQDALKGRELGMFPLGESVIFSSEEALLSLSLE